MKYLLSFKVKDPVSENWKKILALSVERDQKGIGIGDPKVLPWHYALPEGKTVAVIEKDDPNIILKWLQDFSPYGTLKAIPIIDAAQYQEKFPMRS